MDDLDEIRSVAHAHTVEIPRVRGSRFVADIAPVSDEASALSFVAAVRRREPDATHHCWAFRLAGGRGRSDDDGEPGGTAGAPIQRHLAGADLADVVVVVSRWFGGTRLGRGGLARAYGAAARAAIDGALPVVRPVVAVLDLDHDYDVSSAVESALASHGVEVLEAAYGARVSLRVAVRRRDASTFSTALSEATAGRVVARNAD